MNYPVAGRPMSAEAPLLCACCCGVAVLTFSAITLIVISILGACDVIHMSPATVQTLSGLGSAIIFGMIIGVMRTCFGR